jgi:Arc/MetJ-type ribon-helix-helix transcriptional regulator
MQGKGRGRARPSGVSGFEPLRLVDIFQPPARLKENRQCEKDNLMALQLTPEQEQRIRAMVTAGAYPSAEDALNAAVAAVETAATLDFEGAPEELERELVQGLSSNELSEEEFWESVDRETNDRLAAAKPEPLM